jgi:hypothetical protein
MKNRILTVMLPGGVAAAFLFCLPSSAGTVLIKDFETLMSALEVGESLRAVFHYKTMVLTIAGKAEPLVPDAVGGMSLGTWEAFAAGAVGNKERFVTSSENHLIKHPRYGFVLNYVKVSVFESGAVRILAQYLDPRTLEVRMDETFTTRIADGQNGAGAFFYRAN